MILIIEGVDGAGKTTLANKLEELGLTLINCELSKKFSFEHNLVSYPYFATGYNCAMLDTFKVLDNLIKDRFHLSEFVYSKFYKRESFISFQETEDALLSLNKFVGLILIDAPPYDEYIKRKKDLNDEAAKTKNDLEEQALLFIEAYSKSRLKKMIITNNIPLNYLKIYIKSFWMSDYGKF